MRKLFTLKTLLLLLISGLFVLNSSAQLSITSTGTAFTENFNSMGSSATATLPAGFKIGTDWSTGTSSTTIAYGTTGTGVVNGTSSGGVINWANGITASSTDRCLGFLNTGTFTSPRSIVLKLANNTGSTIVSLNISFDYEKYRSGSRQYDWTFFHGNTVTPATSASAGDQSYPADAANTTVNNPPTTITKSVNLTGLSIPNGADYYLKWTFTGLSGSTNGQGIGIDNFSIAATGLISSDAALSNLALSSGTLTPTFASGTTSYTASVASNVSSINVTPTANESHASITVNGIAVASGSASSAIALSVGDNVITTIVTAQDGTTTKTYTVTVNRAAPGVPALTASTLSDFGNVCINTSAGPNSFTLDGINLDGSNITVGTLPGFSYSETSNGTYTNTLPISYSGNSFTGKIIYVKFAPTTVQSYNGNINISGGGVAGYNVPATGTGVNSGPSITNGNSSAVTATTATLTDTITVAGCSAITSYGFEYSLNSGFADGTGTQVLSSNLNSGIFSAPVTGLMPNQQYFYKAFAATSGGTTYGSQRSFINAPLPVSMSSQPGLNYTEDFHDILNWTNFFISGEGANHFDGLSANATGTIPDGIKLTASTNSFATGSSGGIQKGTDQSPSSQSIVLLSTGSSPENSTSAAIDFYLDFTNVNAGTLSFDWASINNSTGDRKGSLRVYGSTNGTTFIRIDSVLNFTNNNPTSGSVLNVSLPSSFNNSATARLRFYYSNGTGGTIGSRPKISIDNLTITAVPSTPCSTPTAQPSSMVFGTITDVSIAGSFSAASPASDQYLTIVSTNSSLTSNPTDGTIYNVGDAFGDGTVIAKGSSLNFTATGLAPATTYCFFTYAVNGVCTGGPKYFTADPLVNSATTNSPLPSCVAPSSQVTNLIFENPSINTIQGSFTAATADEYLVLVSTAASLSNLPANGIVYNTGDIIGNATVVQRSTATSFTANGLSAGTQYYFFIFSLNSQNCINGPTYNTVEPLNGSQTTQPLPPCATPTSQPTLFTLHAANNSISGTFNGSNSADDYLVIRSTSSTLSESPADNTDYNVGATLGGGIVVSNSSATSFLTTNLSTSTTYYFFVFAANKNCSGGTKYLTASPLTGLATTTSFVQNNYYFGTLHSHSDYSDGNKDHPGYTPADDYNYAMTAQCLDFLGISEHNHFSSPDNPGNTITNYHKGPVQADSFTNVHPNFLALYGMEWGVISGGGHVVVYGDKMDKLFGWESGNGGWGPTDNYDVYVPKSVYTGSTGLFKTINNINDTTATALNTFATLAHPNQTDFNNLAGIAYDSVADRAIVGSAVESGPATSTNTTYSNPGSPMYYLWYYQTLLSKGYHLGPTIDHDNHNTTFGHTTFSRTAVIAPSLSKTDIIKAMHNMHFYATEDCDSKVDFTINTKMMGSVFSDRNAPAISVTLSDLTNNTSSAIIRVMYGKPGSGVMPVKIDSAIGNTLFFVDNNLANGETGYYYIDITNGTSRIVTSPIWYTRTCSLESNTTIYSCNSYDWNGQTYTESGTYSKTGMTSTGGCDSTAILHLTITAPTTGDTTVVACDSYTWYGTTYTESGTATKVLKERGGCDSTVTLHLTINHSSTSSETAATCDSYTWHDSTYTTSGVYIYQSLNAEGCTNTDTLHLTIEDTQDPTITAPSAVSVNADNGNCSATNVALGTPVTDDNCGVASVTNDAPSSFPVGTTTVTWTVTDTHGRTATATQTVTVTDNQDPTITAPSEVSVNADNGSCAATNVPLGTPTYGDNCAANTPTNDAPSSFPVGETTVTWTVTDTHGHSATATQKVTVIDNQNPTIIAPANVSVNADNGSCAATNVPLGTPTYGDNCAANTPTNDAPLSYPVGQTTVTWTVTDTHGHSATATQKITVTDNQNPTITCRANQTRLVNNANCTYKVSGTEFDPTAFNDNCPGATIKNNFNNSSTLAGAVFPKGTTIVTWTVTDARGHTANCTTTITINSTLAISIPDVYAVQPGGAANTIYIGYGPGSVTLNAAVTGGTAPYSYKWTIGSNAGQAISTSSSFTVNPTTTTTYYLNVKDAFGCTVTFVTKTIQIVDVRCGSKVTVCVYNKGKYTTSCVTSNSVSAYLSNGSYLGSCTTTLISSARSTSVQTTGIKAQPVTDNFDVMVSPNPSATDFKLVVQSNSAEPITIRLQDVSGRVLNQIDKIQRNENVRVGNGLIGGTYFAEVTQGTNRKVIKLIKL